MLILYTVNTFEKGIFREFTILKIAFEKVFTVSPAVRGIMLHILADLHFCSSMIYLHVSCKFAFLHFCSSMIYLHIYFDSVLLS